MNREIKFRGKSIENREWLYGNLITTKTKTFILTNAGFSAGHEISFSIDVDPKTVGQYIGIKDKNKKEIYQGGILKNTISKDMFYIEWGKKHDYCGWVTVLIRNNERNLFLSRNFNNCVIIGNIHDNPELLEN